jgi:hypothetical protein
MLQTRAGSKKAWIPRCAACVCQCNINTTEYCVIMTTFFIILLIIYVGMRIFSYVLSEFSVISSPWQVFKSYSLAMKGPFMRASRKIGGGKPAYSRHSPTGKGRTIACKMRDERDYREISGHGRQTLLCPYCP